MNDLRKAAETALEALESWQKTCLDCGRASDELGRATAPIQALRQALAQPEQEPIAWMCEDPHHIGQCVTIYKTPPSIEAAVLAEREATPEQGNNSPNYPISESSTPFVDAVNMSEERVDETAKGEHEPLCYLRDDIDRPFGGFEHCGEHDPGAFPVYLAPPKRDSSSWVGLSDVDRVNLCGMIFGGRFLECIDAIEAKLKEKNHG